MAQRKRVGDERQGALEGKLRVNGTMKKPIATLWLGRLKFSLVAFLLVLAAAARAEEPRFSEEQIDQLLARVEATQERLQLTEAQKAEVAPILEKSREKRLSILEGYGFGGGSKPELSFREKRALAKEMKAVRGDTEKQLATVLSAEQMAEYKKIQDENRDRLRERMKSRSR